MGAAAARSAFWSPRSVLLLIVALCCGDGSAGVPPRGRLGDGGGRVEWGFRPSARPSTLRRFLHRRGGAGKVCRRLFLSLDVSPVQGMWWMGGWSGAKRPFLRRLLLDREVGVPRPLLVHRLRFRRSSSGGSCVLKAWWCSPSQVWWMSDIFFSGVAGSGGRQVARWFSFVAVVLVLFSQLFVCAYVSCSVLSFI